MHHATSAAALGTHACLALRSSSPGRTTAQPCDQGPFRGASRPALLYPLRFTNAHATTALRVSLQWGLGDVLAQKAAERRPVLDRRRVALTATFGMGFMGPVGHFWYLGL